MRAAAGAEIGARARNVSDAQGQAIWLDSGADSSDGELLPGASVEDSYVDRGTASGFSRRWRPPNRSLHRLRRPMGPVSAEIEIDVPRQRAFEAIADLSLRPAFTDHFLDGFRLT